MVQKNKTLIVILGPTGVGKTDTTIRLAQHFQADILSCDARQMYQQMNIGTAKPTEAEQAAAPHHFIDFLPVETAYSAGKFEKDALEVLDKIFQEKAVALMTGGSTLYIQAVCEGLDDFPEIDPKYRAQLNFIYEEKGVEALQTILQEKDKPVFDSLNESDRQNPQRLIRAIEVIESTGKSIREFRVKNIKERPFKIIKIGLEREREKLYERINQRVDLMMEAGLEAEAKALFPHAHYNALQTVGYQELFGYFRNEYDLIEAVRLIKRNTRRYAKRQMTWFRKDENITWFQPDDFEAILGFVQHYIGSDHEK